MKNIILILSMFFIFTGCEKKTEPEPEPQENSIYGTWKLIEVYFNIGYGNGNWSKVHDGYQFSIKSNNTFNSSEFPECSNGVVDINETQIVFKYECDGFTSGIDPTGELSYNYAFVENKLALNPNFLNCAEGCGYRFLKID